MAVTSSGATAAAPSRLTDEPATIQPEAISPFGLFLPTTISRQFSPTGMPATDAFTRTQPGAGMTVAVSRVPVCGSTVVPDRVPDGSGETVTADGVGPAP